MKLILILILFIHPFLSFGQLDDFPKIKYNELEQKIYSIDSSANAVVLFEEGRSRITDSEADRSYMVYHTYKVRIKIINTEGFDKANFSIPLYKFGNIFERVSSIKGRSYNINNNKITSLDLESKNIFTENKSEYFKLTKFTLPDIQEGTIIDVYYIIESPDILNFRTWEFQTDIPKLNSSYQVSIPACYNYNVTLKGFLKLSDTKTKVENQCLFYEGVRVDCSNINYTMKDIPAFHNEPHMLSEKNYKSAINFELKEIHRPNGNKTVLSQEWKNVDKELLTEKNFGGQLKKIDFFKKTMPAELIVNDKLKTASNIYDWIQKQIKWNNYYGKHCQYGIEDAFEKNSGNVADINISLIAALNFAGIEAYPIILATRENAFPHDIHPVLSDFNYVIAGVKIDSIIYQLDASDALLPFGQLPLHTINGNGRIIYSRKSSEWIPIETKIISSVKYIFNGELGLDGKLKGNLQILYSGLEAYHKRKEVLKAGNIENYKEKLDDAWTYIDIENMNINMQDPLSSVLIINSEITAQITSPIEGENNILFNPIFLNRTTTNPFNLDERNFHVDLGAKRDEYFEITIKIPESLTMVSLPKSINLTLPNNSARYYYKADFKDNILNTVQLLSLKQAVYQPEEYFGLKELFSRMIQQLKIDYNFKNKKS